MLLSSKNDESDGIKTFEVYSSYITLASNSAFFIIKTAIAKKDVFSLQNKIHGVSYSRPF